MRRFSRIFFPFIYKKFITVLCLLICGTCLAQDPFINKLTTSLSDHEAKESKEKIYLQTDKSFYISGEILWFKSYVVDATRNKFFSLSQSGLRRSIKPGVKAGYTGKNTHSEWHWQRILLYSSIAPHRLL